MKRFFAWILLMASAESDAIQWLRDCQGHFSQKLHVAKSHGRGIFAKEDISPEQLLISVPSRCILYDETIETIENETIGESEVSNMSSMSSVVAYLRQNQTARAFVSNKFLLSVFIMQQLVTRPSNRFKAYLLDLRSSVESIPEIPLFWTKEDKAELKGTLASLELPKMFRAIGQEYEVLKAASPTLTAKHGLMEFQVAYAFVASRSFTLHLPDRLDRPLAALYPLIDLVNHAEDTSAIADAGRARVEIQQSATGFNALLKSQEAFAKGEELSISYGFFSNTHLLLRYGFVTPNLHNSTCLTKVKVQFQAVDRFQRETTSLLSQASGKSLAFTLDTCPGEGALRKALSFIRIWRSRHADRCIKATGAWTEWQLDLSCEWLSATEETEALTDLSMAISEACLRYPGGSLEDEGKLLAKRLTSKRRTAIVVRRDEKYTLWKLQSLVSQAKERLQRLMENHSGNPRWRHYIDAVTHEEL